MKRLSILFTAIFAFMAFFFSISENVKAEISIGGTVENFSLPDTNGKKQTLNDLKGEKGTVVVFLSAQCPVVRGYNDRINQIAADYKAKGINFIGINSNSTESLELVKSHADETYNFTVADNKPIPEGETVPVRASGNYKIPVLIDKGNVIADQFGANVTPEIFYLDEKNVLIYHGAIDNDRSGKNITINYLRDAFDLTLAGKAVTKTTANAFGCGIKRVSKN